MKKSVKRLTIPFVVLRAFMATTPVVTTITFAGCSTTYGSSTETASVTKTGTESGAIITESVNMGLKVTAASYTLATAASYSAGDNYDSSEDSSLNVCRLTASSDNHVTLTAATWKASWQSSNIGLTISDYVSITNVTSDGLTVQVAVKKAFGYPIVITATSSDNANATGSVTINYVKRISGFSVSMGTVSTVSENDYSIKASSLTGTGTYTPNVSYAYYIKFSSDFSDTAESYIAIDKTMTGIRWYELISSYAKSNDVLEDLLTNGNDGYISIYVTATVTYGEEIYQFITSEAYYPTFTSETELNVTVSDGSTSQDFSNSDSDSGDSSGSGTSTAAVTFETYENEVSVAVGGSTDYTISVSSELEDAVTVTQTEDGITITKNDDYADVPVSGTVTIGSGSQWIEIGISFVTAFSVSETSIELNGASGTYTDITVSGGTGNYSVELSADLESVISYAWQDSSTLRLSYTYSESASGTVTIRSGSQSAVISVTLTNDLTVSAEEICFTTFIDSEANVYDTQTITVSGGTGSYSYILDCGDYPASCVTCVWTDGNTLQVSAKGESSSVITSGTVYYGTLTITSGSLTKTIKLVFNVTYCLTGDMLITMADGTQKRVDSLSVGEKVLSFNPDTMRLEADEITYSDSSMDKRHAEYDIWTFSDGTEIKTVHRHRFYNIEAQAMVNLDEWHIGGHTYRIDGKAVELIKHENVKEETNHYTLFTKNQNYFVNGLLSGNKYTRKLAL